MGILKNIFGKKDEVVKKTKPKVTEYFIDIDPSSDSLSKAFEDFYQNHFVNAYGLSRNEVDTYFFTQCLKMKNRLLNGSFVKI